MNSMHFWNYLAIKLIVLCALTLAAMSPSAIASSESKEFNEGVNYINLPRVYANFGAPERKQFVQAEVSLRTESAQSAAIVSHHLPLVRDRMLRIISQQSEEVLTSTEGRDLLRAAAIKMINQSITEVEAGDEDANLVNYVSDVYFTNFIMQR